jgi:uncharacterized protein (DUF1786 family)
MNFYDLLEKLAKELPSINDQKAAREVIGNLRGVNAFGSVIAEMESETPGDGHVHRLETRRYEYDQSLVIDVCTECEVKLSRPYDNTNRYPGYRGQRY